MNKKTAGAGKKASDRGKKKDTGKNVHSKLKINPDNRANENIPEEKRRTKTGNSDGVGSEITDGED